MPLKRKSGIGKFFLVLFSAVTITGCSSNQDVGTKANGQANDSKGGRTLVIARLSDAENLDQQFLPEKEQFGFFEGEKEAQLSEDFDEKLVDLIKSQENTNTFNIRSYWRAAAAIILVAAGLSVWFFRPETQIFHERSI